MHPRTTRSILGLALTVGALGALAACGDEADADEVPAEACDAAIDFGRAFAEAPQDPAEFGAYAADRLVPIGKVLEEHLDGAAGDAATQLAVAFAAVAESGDPGRMETPEAAAARTTVGAAIHDGCDVQTVDIGAIEYAFTDVPARLDAGRTSFALTNEGVEDHEMVLFRRADGVTESLDELLELPEDEMGSKMAFTGVTFGGPESTSYTAVDLEPGTYFLLCFLPQGGDEAAPPHFMGGMKATIEVS